MSELLDYFKSHEQAMIDLLTQMVNIESFSTAKSNVDNMAAFMEAQFKSLNASSVERIPQEEVGDFVLAKWHEDQPGKPILFLVHMDTVFPIGTVAERPVRFEGGLMYGSGACDMKGGIVIALSAIRGLQERGELPQRPIWFLATSDEEIGSNHSRPLIMELAQQAGLVVVLEPGTKDGEIKVQRKGVATFRVTVEGRAAHAGNAPEEGINAIVELAQQVVKINKLNDLKNGTSVSVTMTQGGSAGNVIPAQASAFIDCRVVTQAAMDQLQSAMSSLEPHVPGAKVHVENIHMREPMEFNDQMKQTFAQVQEIGKKHDITVRGTSVGGGSDGNITAGMGIPTLDGMGAIGDGLHATHEHILTSSLPQQAALVAGVIKEWQM